VPEGDNVGARRWLVSGHIVGSFVELEEGGELRRVTCPRCIVGGYGVSCILC
jgi:hypothetical protein